VVAEEPIVKIRRFQKGKDEADWVHVWNTAYQEYEDIRKITAADFRLAEAAPSFDPEGRFIAEVDGEPVGIIHAHVDKLRKEPKGFIRSFGVIPKLRGGDIEHQLIHLALAELKRRGMTTVQGWARSTRTDRVRLWKTLGFKRVRESSLMQRTLHTLPSNIGENQQVQLRPLRTKSDMDLQTLNWLDNECFKEHFNFRPGTLEETIHFVRKDPFFKLQRWFFAEADGEVQPVGYVGAGIDAAYNTERHAHCGWILDIGVLKAHRLKGIGTTLMLAGMDVLKKEGMTMVMLGVDDQNVTKAIKLYEKVGFHVKKRDLTFEKPLF
jgi:GNAT superfamily N-acetyltransferase